jgi:hypothetical protein
MSDPIDTIDAAIGELNRRYDRDLPRLADLPEGSVLAALWSLPVTLDPNPPAPMVFKACATRSYAFNGKLDGQLILFVTPAGSEPGPLTPCPDPHQAKE